MSSDVSFTLCSGSYVSQQVNTFDNSWLSSTRSDFKKLYPEDEEGSTTSQTGRKDLDFLYKDADFLYKDAGEVKERKPVPRFRINATVEPEEAAEEKKIVTPGELTFDSLFGDDGLIYSNAKKGTSLDTTA